jgi:hypothetical protein
VAKGTCRCCGNDFTINANGTLRFHIAADPECQDGNDRDSRKCRGAGQPPAGSVLPASEPEAAGSGYVCRDCKHPVQLTSNGRARSHLDPRSNPPANCGGGSDWPMWHNGRGSYRDEAPKGEIRQAVGPEGLLLDDGPRTAGEFDPRPVTCTYGCLTDGVNYPECPVHSAGTVLDRMTPEQRTAALGFGLGPGNGLEGECDHDWGGADVLNDEGDEDQVTACNKCGLIYPEDDEPGPMAVGVMEDMTAPFDVTHTVATGLGTETHPGEATDCRLAGCCTHPQGFQWVDDGIGHEGAFCAVCGTEEPEPPAPGPDDWETPPHLIADMPPEIRELAATNPECWDCEHEVTPLVARFGIVDGKLGVPVEIVWGCSRNCEHSSGSAHYGQPCRPQRPEQDRLGNLTEGCLFVRHTAKPPLSSLVYRVQGGSYGPDGPISVTALVVSAGPYGGRTGELTNLDEEITCTDLDGRPRPRRDNTAAGTLGAAKRPGPLDPAETRAPTPWGLPSGTDRPTARPSTRSTPGPTPQPTPAPTTAPSSGPDTTASAPSRSASRAGTSSRATTSGPTARAAGSTPRARRSAVPDAFSTAKQATKESDKYDTFGRYKMLHPDSGKAVKWTRATTFAKSIQDTFALSMWAQRMALKGASLRADIVAAVSTLDVKQDKDRVNSLVEDAKKAAGDKVAANKGTAVHAFTEDRDKVLVGEPVSRDREVPEEFVPTVEAYEAVLRDFGLEPVPGLIEFTTAVKQYEVAGTSDRVYKVTRNMTFKLNGRSVTLYAGEYVIGDVKTGADLSYGWQEICIQLALYAQGLNTSGVWSWSQRQWAKPVTPDNPDVLLKVRTDVGLIPHLPVDRKEGAPLATLYAVDLDAGWAAAVLCASVRSWRKERTLATPLTVAAIEDTETAADTVRRAPVGRDHDGEEPATRRAPKAKPVTSSRPATLEEKARAVTSQAEASAVWKEATAARTPKAEVDRLVEIMKKKLESFVEQGA